MSQINYTTKVENGGTSSAGKVNAANMNEIKTVVNSNETQQINGDATTLSSANAYTDSQVSALLGGNVIPQTSKNAYGIVGSIFNYTNFTSTSDYAISAGVTASVASDILTITSAGGDYNHYVSYNKVGDNHRYSGLENWTQTIVFTIGAITSTSYGIGLGMASVNSNNYFGVEGRIDLSSNGSIGKLLIDYISGPGKIGTNAATTSVGIPGGIHTGDVIALSFSRVDGYNFFCTAVNTTTSNTISLSYADSPQGPNYPPNTGQFSIFSFGGTQAVSSWSCSSTSTTSVPYLFLGDSKTVGVVNSINNSINGEGYRYPDQCVNGSWEVNAGGSDVTQSLIYKMPEILQQAGSTGVIFVMIGGNDIRYSIPTLTWQANLSSIRSSIVGNGNKIVWLTYIPEGSSLNTDPINAYIKSTFSSDTIIDVAQLFGVDGAIAMTYYNADGIHLNGVGHKKMANYIKKKYFN